MDRIGAYLAKSRKRLRAAELLLAEGFYGDAVSRAYYAIFNAAKAALSSRGKDAKTHGGLIALFGLEFVKSGEFEKELGRAFSLVEEEREEADYEPLTETSREEAEDAVEKAARFLSVVEKYLKE